MRGTQRCPLPFRVTTDRGGSQRRRPGPSGLLPALRLLAPLLLERVRSLSRLASGDSSKGGRRGGGGSTTWHVVVHASGGTIDTLRGADRDTLRLSYPQPHLAAAAAALAGQPGPAPG